MKKILALLLLSITLFSCGPDKYDLQIDDFERQAETYEEISDRYFWMYNRTRHIDSQRAETFWNHYLEYSELKNKAKVKADSVRVEKSLKRIENLKK